MKAYQLLMNCEIASRIIENSKFEYSPDELELKPKPEYH